MKKKKKSKYANFWVHADLVNIRFEIMVSDFQQAKSNHFDYGRNIKSKKSHILERG